MTTIRTDNNGQQVTSPPPHWLDTLLPIRALTVEMCFTEYSSPGFFHQAAVTAWLMRLLQSPDHYAFHLTIDTPEQGRCHFDEGDHYRFTLFAMGHQGEDWLTKIALLLRSGVSGIAWDRPMPFRNNWRLSALLSWPDGEAIDPQQPLTPIDQTTVAQEVAWLRTQPVITLRTTSPWRILRNKDDQLKHKGEMRFCRNSDDLVTNKTPLWLMRIGDALRALAKNRGAAVTPREAVSEITTQGDLFWVDASYSNRQGNRKPMGGLMGEICSIKPTQLTEVQLKMLIIGQYVGIGQRRSFGYGRYQILDERGEPRFARSASGSLLERAMEVNNLQQAQAKVMEESDPDATDVHQDGEDGAEPVRDDEKLNALASKLLHGQYRPPPLNGFIHEDADGGIRPLAAPPVYDRILQRAVHQQLSPMLDTIMERASYGFRTGRSRYQVRDLIQSLYRQGYRWVFESDIRSFFDTVTWSRLAVRLHALLGDDPAVAMILEWMQQPVRWQNRLIVRQGGLPQGSPLSPVLANMMLDDQQFPPAHRVDATTW